ncbi:MAG: type II toxin-antitoxin system VapB family antitoxin [Deltaproteobacteria bacterium]|nr:type II toxin-antitoxin system VapB family antitoxin [Deltaproteobacteria bacterium]
MRTTINVNNNLINELLKRTKSRTKTEAIETAIRDFLDKKAIEDLISLNGKIDIDRDWQKDEEKELKEYNGHR